MSRVLCVVLFLLTASALSAQGEGHRVRNIVLVRGAWADGSAACVRISALNWI
jgi:hypothetical protein